MLSNTLINTPRREGLHTLQRRGEHGARELTTHRLTLSPGRSEDFSAPDEETIIVLLEGAGTFEAGGHFWSVQRANVFSDRATALLLPPGALLTVRADRPLEALLIST